MYLGWIKAAANGPFLELWPHGLINILVNNQTLKAQIQWSTDRCPKESRFCLALDSARYCTVGSFGLVDLSNDLQKASLNTTL